MRRDGGLAQCLDGLILAGGEGGDAPEHAPLSLYASANRTACKDQVQRLDRPKGVSLWGCNVAPPPSAPHSLRPTSLPPTPVVQRPGPLPSRIRSCRCRRGRTGSRRNPEPCPAGSVEVWRCRGMHSYRRRQAQHLITHSMASHDTHPPCVLIPYPPPPCLCERLVALVGEWCVDQLLRIALVQRKVWGIMARHHLLAVLGKVDRAAPCPAPAASSTSAAASTPTLMPMSPAAATAARTRGSE